jgi:hypothetical protein
LPQVTLRQATSVSCTTCMLKRLWSQKILNQPNACMLIKLRFELHKLHYPSRHADVTVDRFALPVPLARARRRLSALGGIYASIFRSHTSPHTMMFTIARRAEKFKVRLCPFRKKSPGSGESANCSRTPQARRLRRSGHPGHGFPPRLPQTGPRLSVGDHTAGRAKVVRIFIP